MENDVLLVEAIRRISAMLLQRQEQPRRADDSELRRYGAELCRHKGREFGLHCFDRLAPGPVIEDDRGGHLIDHERRL